MSDSFKQWLPVSAAANRTRMQLVQLEDRDVPAYLFVDFGDNFLNGVLNTTQGGLRDVANGPTDGEIILGSQITDAANQFNDATALTIRRQFYSDQDKADMLALSQRAFLPLNINVVFLTPTPQSTADGRVVRGAQSMNDVIATLRAGDATSKDSYVFATQFVVAPGTAVQQVYGPNGGGTSPGPNKFGIASDLGTASNQHDDVALAFSFGPYNFNTANNINHEAGHAFGLQHGLTNPATDVAVSLLHQSELMSYENTNLTSSSFFNRYPLIHGDDNSPRAGFVPTNYDDLLARRGTITPYDQFRLDPNIGANPNFTFVSGTGANDIVRISRSSATAATVTVQAFSSPDYDPLSAIEVPGTKTQGSVYSYEIPLDKTILVYGGQGNDAYIIDSELGATLDIRGMNGGDQLIVDGQGAATSATYTPAPSNPRNPERVNSVTGTLTTGTTAVRFENSGANAFVATRNMGTVTFASPQGVDDLLLRQFGGFPEVGGRVNGGVLTLPLTLINTNRLVIDTGNGDAGAAVNDSLAVDFSNGNPVPAGGVLYAGGGGTDRVTSTSDSDFVLNDALLRVGNFPPIELDSVESAVLTGGASSNTFDLNGWSNFAAVDGKGGIDTLVVTKGANAWSVDRADGGVVNGRVTFDSVGNLVGGDQADTFSFSGSGRVTGAVVGAGGANSISLAGVSSAQTVALNDLGGTSGFNGSVTARADATGKVVATVAGGFSDIAAVTGSGQDGDALVGLAANSTWDYAGTGGSYKADAAGRTLAYDGFESLYGGAARDVFGIRSATAAGKTIAFFGQGGDDSFRVNSNAGADDAGNLDNVLANIVVDGGAGANALVVSDFSGGANAGVVVSADAITGLAPGAIFYRSTGGSFGTAGDGVVIRSSDAGNDNFFVRGTAAGASTRVEGLGGDDTFNVTGPGDTLAALAGQLVLQFGAGNDSVTVSDRGNLAPTVGTLSALQITGLGLTAGLVYLDAPENLAVETGSGADTFTVQGTTPGTSVRLNTGAGADRVFVRAVASPTLVQTGDDDDDIQVASDAGFGQIGTLGQIVGDLTLDAGGGFANRLVVSDFGGSAHPNVTISADRVTGLAPGAINYASSGGGFAATGGLVFRGSDFAPDNFTIVGSIANSGTRVEGLGGDDSFTVSGQNGNLDSLTGAVFVDGGVGTNALSVNDVNATRGNAAGRVTGTQVAGFAGPNDDAAVNYANVRTLNVRGSELADAITVINPSALLTLDSGGGDDAVRVEALAGDSPLRVVLSEGDDTADVGGGATGLRAILSEVSFDGGGGRNTLSISDAGSNLGDAGVRVTANQVTGLAGPGGAAAVNYAGFANLNLRGSEAADGITLFAATAAVTVDGGGGDDVIRVESVAAGLPATVTGGGGDDQITVTNLDAIQAPLTAAGGGGLDRIAVTDLGSEGRAYTLGRTTLGRLGFAGLTYTGFDAMTLRGGDGANQYAVTGTGAASSTVIDDGAGNSTFAIRGDGLTGRSGFNGNGGDDTFTVDGSNGLTGASVAVAVVGGAGSDTLRVTGRPGDDALTVRAIRPTIGTLDGLGQTANFETVEDVIVDGQGGTNTLAFVDDSDATYGSATDPDGGIVYRPTGAASGNVRIGATPFPTVSFLGVNGLFTVSGDGDGSGDRDTLTVIAPDGAPQTLSVTEAAVQIANAGGNLRAVNLVDGNGRPSIANLVVRGGDANDTFTVQPSSRLNVLIDGGAGADELRTDGVRGTVAPTVDPQFGPPQIRSTVAGGASFGYVNVERAPGTSLLVSGAAAPGGSRVTVVDPATGEKRFADLTPFPGYSGGLSVAAGDVNGDGVADIVVGAGLGGGPVVVVYDGLDGREIVRFFAYEADVRSGVQVAVGDIDGDGFGDIVTGTGVGGGPRVQAFSGFDFAKTVDYFAYEDSFRGGVTVAAADTDGDGVADIITGTGPGGSPRVTVVSGGTLGTRADFFAFDGNLRGGVAVAGGDINGDGVADFVAATASGGQTLVRAFSGTDATLLVDSAIANADQVIGGTRVGVADVDGDGIADILLSNDAAGTPLVRGFKVATRTADGVTLGFDEVFSKSLFGTGFQSGSSVAGLG